MSILFDSTAYYRLSCDRYGQETRLSDGSDPDQPDPLFLGTTSYSSENWQIYFQDEVYFIRNFDYGANYQLAVSSTTDTQPQLLPATGDLAQQWNITVWPDGTRKLVNLAVGEFQILGVSNTSEEVIIPVMNTAEEGSHWTFDINSSAGEVSADMTLPLTSVAKASTTATSTSPAQSTATAQSTSPVIPDTSSNAQKSSSLPAGAIAGIAVGGVALAAFVIMAIFSMMRKRSRAGKHARNELPTSSSVTYRDDPYGSHVLHQTTHQLPTETYVDRKVRTSVHAGAVEMPP
ncbi:hypothetical protein LTR20_010353 [Exophiala xenobiotica]|nr:hypothetical protein LTS13_003847 [Exophiala xenobiotica]KAK5395416.1 hypothetical protein LTR79_007130 [Exophiala xenobiotica]KAK5407550.1 hypothetical protein LTR90_010133 [Exophiala xenobiotica]KAK5453844.1 hypothetical protein LTR20_010353 [Exophiala xenobiotica]KAK5483801.1 hypothetical protein LTR26_006234 [Exophiala xenobiotica]